MTEEDLFHAALARPRAERDAFLDQACSGDAPLRAAVQALLAAHEAPGSFLKTHLNPPGANPAEGGLAATQDSRVAAEGEHAGAREHQPSSGGARDVRPSQTATTAYRRDAVAGVVIGGRYTLLEKIGEGGMGEVWVAKQTEPVKRKVALKLIKTGMDSRAVLKRFEQERQALALMDHPHIARVLDGGMTPSGQPFFVMELVNGLSLTTFCDELRLTPKARLELFVPICQAVQHAHHKGIVHRDLKPANILVTMIDGKPVPKVIDFGVAKATSSKLTPETMSTGFGAVVGTLEYMSPEQAGFSGDDIDTRADIYSLGVILYELLTGLRPLDAQRLKKAALTEMIRIIQEEEPSKPSTRLSTDESLPSLAAVRQIEPRKLTALLRGELDWVVMKCLEKQRERRYETANGLARDIQRYLADEAVEARPPSAGYRIQKFIHRNRVMVAAGGAVAVALLVGAVAFAWQAKVAREQRDLAVAAQRAEAEQRKVAHDASVEAQRQEAEAHKQEAEARKQADEARKQAAIAEAVTSFQAEMLAAVDPDQLPKDPVTKEPLRDKLTVVQVLESAVQKLDEGSLKDQPLVEAGVRATIADTLHNLGRFAEAERNLRKVVAIRRAAHPAGNPEIATALNNLATVLLDQNKLAEAESLYRESLKTRPADDPSIAQVLDNLAKLLQMQGKIAEAEPLQREALAIRRMFLPSWDPDLAIGLHNLAMVLSERGKFDDAEPLCREALRIVRVAYPDGHPEIAPILDGLGEVLQNQNKLSEAELLVREALKIRRAAYPDGHHAIALSLNNLATLLLVQNKLAEAESLFREAAEIVRAAFPPEHPNTARVLRNLALALEGQNKLAEAEPVYREVLKMNRAALPDDSPQLAGLLVSLGAILLEQKKWTEAEPLLRECLAIRKKAEPDAWSTFNTQSLLGAALLGRSAYSDAEPLLLEGYEGMKTREKSVPPQGAIRIPKALDQLVALYTAWHAAEPEKGYDAKAASWQKKREEHNAAAKGTPASSDDR